MRAIPRKIYRQGIRLAWYLNGQKEHSSGISVPPVGFIASDAKFVFPERITLDDGVMVMDGARLICAGMPPYTFGSGSISIGVGSVIRENAILQTYGGHIALGRECTVNPHCMIQGNGDISVGDGTLIASHVSMYAANHRFADPDRPIRSQGETRRGIRIGRDVWIGGGARILDGVTIADGAVVAAGAVVNRDVAAHTVVAGVPASPIGKRGGVI